MVMGQQSLLDGSTTTQTQQEVGSSSSKTGFVVPVATKSVAKQSKELGIVTWIWLAEAVSEERRTDDGDLARPRGLRPS